MEIPSIKRSYQLIYAYLRTTPTGQPFQQDVQRESLKKFVNEKQDQYRTYDERGYGRDIEDQPALKRLLVDIEEDDSPEKMVWAYDIDRLTNDPTDAAYITKVFARNKVLLCTTFGSLDFNVSAARLIFEMRAVLASHERKIFV